MPVRRALLVAALTAALILGSAGVASAQMPPFTAYGMGLPVGDVVSASIDGVVCGSARVSAAGNWKISIFADAPCHPRDGLAIHFAVDGKAHAATARWSGGGAPVNPRVGIVLGAAPIQTVTTTPVPTATPRPVATPAPTPKLSAPARVTVPKRIVISTPKKRAVFR